MGFGSLSQEFSFIPRTVPPKPLKAPTNVAESTSRNVIYVRYDEVIEDGGSQITKYNVYIDDGLDGDFGNGIDNGMNLLWDSTGLNLVTGRIYRIKYSSENVHGESELSDEVQILLAEKPSPPINLQRIDMYTDCTLMETYGLMHQIFRR